MFLFEIGVQNPPGGKSPESTAKATNYKVDLCKSPESTAKATNYKVDLLSQEASSLITQGLGLANP